MSAGATEAAKYEANDGKIYPCRAQPETKGLTLNGTANAYPTAAADQVVSVRLKSSKRKIGANARTVTVRLTAALTGYKANALLTVPVFNPTVWNGYKRGDTGTYLATAVEFVGKSAESIK